MKQICLQCDGLGEVVRYSRDMHPLDNIAHFTKGKTECGEAVYLGVGGHSKRLVSYHKPCKCKDGFIEWTRGKSLTPTT